jgi:hypothetical protein
MGRGETVKRIPVIIALFLAVPLIAQTAKPSPQMIFSQGYVATACTKDGQTNCVNVGCFGSNIVKGCPNYADIHGCGDAYLWDAEKNVCSIAIRFETPKLERVYCSASKPHTIPQIVTCRYKPAPAKTPEPTKGTK